MKREGEDSRIVTRLGEGSKVYSTMRLQNDWIVFTEDGSYVFNLRTHQVSRDTELNIARGQVQIDNRGNFWIYNHTGKVWYVNAKTRFVKSFQLIPADKVNYIDEERYHIVHDSRDIVWISTYGNGLFAYDWQLMNCSISNPILMDSVISLQISCNILWRIEPVVFGSVRNIRVFLVFRS